MHIPCIYDIEWDSGKAASNLKNHGISFEEAVTSLLDPMALVQEDGMSEGEHRWTLMGMSERLRLLVVIYTLRGANRIHLISARKATRKEADQYA